MTSAYGIRSAITSAPALQPFRQLDRATAELLDAIARSVLKLPGAACRDHRELFDRTAARGRDITAARTQALQICAGCPALAACQRWISSLDEHERPRGIVAGQLVRYTDAVFVARIRR